MELSSDKVTMVERIMEECLPEEATIVDGCATYHSTQQTHRSYNEQMKGALPNTWARKVYTMRCYEWLLLLKKNDIKVKNIG